MAATMDSLADCELQSMIRFLQQQEGNSAAEIHRRLSVVYGKHCMSDSAVRKQCRQFAIGVGKRKQCRQIKNFVNIRKNGRFIMHSASL